MERTIKFEYFRLKHQVKENNRWVEKGDFNFVSWINNIDQNELLMRTVELKDTKARLEDIRFYDTEYIWGMRFMKLREDNVPSIAKENQAAEDIPLGDDEYIGEDLYMIYDRISKISMVQSNRFSLGITRLAEFLGKTSYLSQERIILKPYSKNIDLKSFRKNKYKTLELGFANLIRDVPQSKSPLSNIINSFHKFWGVSGSVSISLGRTKHDTLNIVEVDDLLEELGDYEEVVSAKIRIKDDDKSYTEIIDLFDNICKDFITFNIPKKQSLGFEYAVRNMIEKYNDRKLELLSLFNVE